MGVIVATTLLVLAGTGILASAAGEDAAPLPTPGCVFSGGAMVCGGAKPTPPPSDRPSTPATSTTPHPTAPASPGPVTPTSTRAPSMSPATPTTSPQPRGSESPQTPAPDTATPRDDDSAGGPVVAILVGGIAVITAGLTVALMARRSRR